MVYANALTITYLLVLCTLYAAAAQGHNANFLIFHNRVNLDDIRYYHVNNIIYYPVQLGEPNSRDGSAICHSIYVDRSSEKVLT